MMQGRFFLLSKHIKRATESLKFMFGKKLDEIETKTTIEKYIYKKRLKNIMLRITFYPDNDDICISFKTREKSMESEQLLKGLSLKFSEIIKSSKSRIIRHKTSNYLENLIELKHAKSQGFDDMIFHNENACLTETCVSNLFFIKNDIVHTPGLECGLLPGIVRGYILELLKDKGMECIEGKFSKQDILKADEVFLTNSGYGIARVRKIENIYFNIENPSKTISFLQKTIKL
jgi:4-amino-4-deoxychorismate lyase